MADINKKLATIEKAISTIKENMVAKGDLSSMTTKDDLKSFETRIKGDVKSFETRIKGDLKNIESRLKGDIKNLEAGIKGNMNTLETRLIEKIYEAQMEIIETVDKHKADKDAVGVLEKRVERLEDNAGLPPYADQ